jgi:hypothetical protein
MTCRLLPAVCSLQKYEPEPTASVPGPTNSLSKSPQHARAGNPLRQWLIPAVAIFLVAFGVRLLSWHDTRLDVGKVQTAVTADYLRVAQLLRQGGLASFVSSTSPLSDLNTLGHPPGYSILMAIVPAVFGESVTAIQFLQIIADAISAVMIFLIIAEILPLSAAVIAGALAAFSPQFAWNSVLLLPDSLAVLPILLAVYCLARAAKRPRVLTLVIAGALVGLSCWLRANAMLLPIFLAGVVPLLITGARQWRFALAVVCGALLIILPLTLRNAIVFHRFIPVSLGAGQTLLEGIADYDLQGRFGIPNTDVGIMKQEAEIYQRPDYYGSLFNPDGVARERARLARGFAVIRAHPFWFTGVMMRRATSMLRLERSRLLSFDPPVSHSLDGLEKAPPVWSATAPDLVSVGTAAPGVRAVFNGPTQTLDLQGDDSKYDEQFSINMSGVKEDTDYALLVPINIERGRVRLVIKDSSGGVRSSRIVETAEDGTAGGSLELIQLPFVASSAEHLHFAIRNEASSSPNPLVKISGLRLYELGPASSVWTRYVRLPIRLVQTGFLTAVLLPLALLGLAILIIRKRSRPLVILSVIPVYYFCVQSIVHTEYRYILAVDYFLFAFAAVGLAWASNALFGRGSSATVRERVCRHSSSSLNNSSP